MQAENFQIGEKLTLFHVNDFMATCHRYEVIVKGAVQTTKGVILALSEKGKRKVFNRLINNWVLVLRGHDLGLKADTEFNTFTGSASFNIVAETPQQASAIIGEHAVELTDFHKSHIRFKPTPEGDNANFDLLPLYPKEYAE